MDIYKLKFTKLQDEIFRFFCFNPGKSFNQRTIAKKLNVSPTAVGNAIQGLIKEELLNKKNHEKMKLIEIELNRDNQKAIELKRTENLKFIYESGLVGFLEEKLPGTTIILFGSYSYGEDIFNSDIDIAIIGSKQKNISLEGFEKLLGREINLNFYQDFKINKNIKNNLFNGIVLVGRIVS